MVHGTHGKRGTVGERILQPISASVFFRVFRGPFSVLLFASFRVFRGPIRCGREASIAQRVHSFVAINRSSPEPSVNGAPSGVAQVEVICRPAARTNSQSSRNG